MLSLETLVICRKLMASEVRHQDAFSQKVAAGTTNWVRRRERTASRRLMLAELDAEIAAREKEEG